MQLITKLDILNNAVVVFQVRHVGLCFLASENEVITPLIY